MRRYITSIIYKRNSMIDNEFAPTSHERFCSLGKNIRRKSALSTSPIPSPALPSLPHSLSKPLPSPTPALTSSIPHLLFPIYLLIHPSKYFSSCVLAHPPISTVSQIFLPARKPTDITPPSYQGAATRSQATTVDPASPSPTTGAHSSSATHEETTRSHR
ncbi:hypothetical protein BDD12DRAFT_529247 [Trichophaea hybrida]|nr:hypothetical protein BDD12DRAFT_529247 [Trichophaea hybrida]